MAFEFKEKINTYENTPINPATNSTKVEEKINKQLTSPLHEEYKQVVRPAFKQQVSKKEDGKTHHISGDTLIGIGRTIYLAALWLQTAALIVYALYGSSIRIVAESLFLAGSAMFWAGIFITVLGKWKRQKDDDWW